MPFIRPEDDEQGQGYETGLLLRPPQPQPKRYDWDDPNAPMGAPKYVPIPSFAESVGLGFQRESWVVALGQKLFREQYPAEDGYNPQEDPLYKDSVFEQYYALNFYGSRSRAETRAIAQRISEEMAQDESLAAAGWHGTVARFGGAIFGDPTIALPGGQIYRSVKGGYSIMKSGVSVGQAGLLQTSIAETGLQTGQETRTGVDSSIAIASGTLLSGIIGIGASALISRGQKAVMSAGLDKYRADMDLHNGSITVMEHAARIAKADAEIAAENAKAAGAAAVPGTAGAAAQSVPAPTSAADYVDNYQAGRGLDSPEHIAFAAKNADAIAAEVTRRNAAAAIEPAPDEVALPGAVPGAAAVPGAPGAAAVPGEAVPGERISAAAIRVGEKVYTGPIHGEAFRAAAEAEGFTNLPAKLDEGFVTTTGRYVTREEAFEIARGAGQATAGEARAAGILDRKITAGEIAFAPPVRPPGGWVGALRETTEVRGLGEPEAPRLGPETPAAAAEVPGGQALPAAEMPPAAPLTVAKFVDDYLAGKVWDNPEAAAFLAKNADAIIAEAKRRGAEAAPVATGTGTAAAAGAAATDTRQLELAGALGFEKIPLGFLGSPIRNVMQSTSVVGRRIMASLAEMPYLFRDNQRNIVTSDVAAIDRLMHMELNSQRVALSDKMMDAYSQYRFGQRVMLPGARDQWQRLTGTTPPDVMSLAEFREAAGEAAMVEGGVHAVKEVTDVAKFANALFEKWGARAEKAEGLGFKRAEQFTKEWYFPHLWDTTKIRQNQGKFIAFLQKIYKAEQTKKFEIQQSLTRRNEQLQDASKQITKLEARLTQLDEDAIERSTVLDALEVANRERDDLRLKIEEDIGRYQGDTTVEAQARLKAREKADAARTPEQKAKQPRLTSADDAVDRAVKAIVDRRDYDKSDEELRGIAAETMKRILGTPDGRLPYDLASARPDVGWTPNSSSEPPRGPLAHRQLNVSNADAKEWLETDLEKVTSVHLRTMVPDVMLAERYGDVRMTMPLKQVSEDYTRLVRAVEDDKTIPESKKGAMIKKLSDEEDMVITVLAGVRDRVRGVYGWSPELRNVARAARAAKQINNLTSMGMAAVGSLADMAGIVMLHGFRNVIQDGWGPYLSQILRNTNAGAEFKRQMRAMGIGVETVINARQHTMDDVMDGAAPQSRFERALQWGNDKFFIGNLLAPQTDAFKQIAAHVVMNEILRASEAVAKGTATKRQLANLHASNISTEMATRIYGEYTRKGGGIEKVDGILLPNTGSWQDQHLAEMFSAAVNREVDIAVVTPGQEKSFWMSHQTLSVLGQFKAFTQSSNERIILGNLQRRDSNVLQGVVFSVMLGMASYKLAGFISGRETSSDPATMIKEGMTRANTLGWMEEGNAIASKLTGGSVDVYRLIGADKPPSRFASRSAADMLLGPTWAKIESLAKIAGSAGTGQWDQYDTTATRRFIALQNILWLNRGFNAAEEGVNNMFGIPMKPRTSP